MTDNVTPFRKTSNPNPIEDQIWVCAHCGQSTFELFRDGTTGCRGCGHRGEFPDGGWSDWKGGDIPADNFSRTTTVFDNAAFAQRSIIKSIDENTTVLVVASDDGMIRAWSAYNFESSHAEKVTVKYLCEQAATLILGEPAIPRPDDALPADDE